MIMKHVFSFWNTIETSKLILLVSYLISLALTLVVIIGAFTEVSMEYVTPNNFSVLCRTVSQ